MNDIQFPFERNRYYYGKMLTSADLQTEKNYISSKRMFENQMMMGSGVLCGLGVSSRDSQPLLIESGAALDGNGREIVVDHAIAKKLGTLEGYEQVKQNEVSLCVAYAESGSQQVAAINRQEGQPEYEYNRIKEQYELFLTDADETRKTMMTDTRFFLVEQLLYEGGYRVCIKNAQNSLQHADGKACFAGGEIYRGRKDILYGRNPADAIVSDGQGDEGAGV